MKPLRRLLIVAACASGIASSCQFMPHALQPSQLSKLNRQEAWDEAQFSVPDPVDHRLSTARRSADGAGALRQE
jgi:hypothetical protein